MFPGVIEMLFGPSFVSLLWFLVTCITCGFIFTVEVLVTIWFIAELRARLYKLKLWRKRLDNGRGRQAPANRTRILTNSQHRMRQRMMRYRRPDYEFDDWFE